MIRALRCALFAVLFFFTDSPIFGMGVRLDLHWYPQSQFAGYYVAFEKGMYLRRGLNVFIYRGGPDRHPVKALISGQADFMTAFLTSALEEREKGVPIVNILQVVNKSNLLLITRKEDNIETVLDLADKKVSLWNSSYSAAYRALFRANGISPEIYPQYFSVELFLRKGVDACSAMAYNEYNKIIQAGYSHDELKIVDLKEEGFGFPEDGVYCLESTWRDNRQMCLDFADASLEGWLYAADRPEEALDIVMKYARRSKIPVNRIHMKNMLEKILSTIIPSEEDFWSLGVLSRSDYLSTGITMVETGFFKEFPFYEAFVVGRASIVK